MTPQELKASILQLAIQGKLVEQRPEEGIGAELLEKILAASASAKASADKKNAKSAKNNLTRRRGERAASAASFGPGCPVSPSCPVAPADAPFDIPESWEWVRLGEVVDILDSMRRPITKADRKPGPYPYYGASCIQDYVADYIFDEPLVLLGEDGAKWGRGDNSAYRISGKTWVNNHAHVLRPLGGVKHDYLVHVLCISDLTSFVTGTTVPKLNQARMCGIPIPLPPLAEQKRIVAKIEELLPYIDRYEKAWSKLEDFNKRFPGDMQKSLLQMAIQGKLVDQRPEEGTGEELLEMILAAKGAKGASRSCASKKSGKAGAVAGTTGTTETTGTGASLGCPVRPGGLGGLGSPVPPADAPFDIPESGVWVRLGEVADVQLGKMLDKGKNKGAPHPYLANLSVRWGSFDLSSLKMMPFTEDECEKFALHPGDVLMCEGGVPGRCAVWRLKNSQIKYQKAVHRIRSKALLADFIQHFFEAICDSSRFASQFTGTTIKHLPRETLVQTLIPLPPLAEQKRIVAKLEELLPLCGRLK